MYLSLLIGSICIAFPVVVTSTNITTSANITTTTNSTTATNITSSTNSTTATNSTSSTNSTTATNSTIEMLSELSKFINDVFDEVNRVYFAFRKQRLNPLGITPGEFLSIADPPVPQGVPKYGIIYFLDHNAFSANVQDLLESYRDVFHRFKRAFGYVILDENYCICNEFASNFTTIQGRVGDTAITIENVINSTGLTHGTNIFPDNPTLVPFPTSMNLTVRTKRDFITLVSLRFNLATALQAFKRTV